MPKNSVPEPFDPQAVAELLTIEGFREKVKNLEADKEKLNQTVKDLTEKLTQSETSQDGIYSELTREVFKKDALVVKLRQEIADLNDATQSSEASHAAQILEIESRLDKELQEKGARIEKLEQELFLLKRYDESKTEHEDALRRLMDTLDGERKLYASRLKEMELKTNEEREQYRVEFEAKVRILNKDLNDSVQRLLSKTTRDAIAATTQANEQLSKQHDEAAQLVAMNSQFESRDKALVAALSLAETAESELTNRVCEYQQYIKTLQGKLQRMEETVAQMEIARLKMDEEMLAKDMKYHRLETVVAKYTTTFRRNEQVWRYLYKAIERIFSKSGIGKETRASKLPVNNSVASHSSIANHNSGGVLNHINGPVAGQNHQHHRGGNTASVGAGGSSNSVNTSYQHTARSSSTVASSSVAGSGISTTNHSHQLPTQTNHKHNHNSPSYQDHESGGLWMNARRHMHLPGSLAHGSEMEERVLDMVDGRDPAAQDMLDTELLQSIQRVITMFPKKFGLRSSVGGTASGQPLSNSGEMMSQPSHDSHSGLDSRMSNFSNHSYRTHTGNHSHNGQTYATNLSGASTTAILTSLVSSPIPSLTTPADGSGGQDYYRDNHNHRYDTTTNNNSNNKVRKHNPTQNHNKGVMDTVHGRGSRSSSLVYPYPVIESDGEDTGDDGNNSGQDDVSLLSMPDFGDEISHLTNDNHSRDGAVGTSTTTKNKSRNNSQSGRGTTYSSRTNQNVGVGGSTISGRISSRETKSRTPKGQGLGRTDKGPGLAPANSAKSPLPSSKHARRNSSNNNNSDEEEKNNRRGGSGMGLHMLITPITTMPRSLSPTNTTSPHALDRAPIITDRTSDTDHPSPTNLPTDLHPSPEQKTNQPSSLLFGDQSIDEGNASVNTTNNNNASSNTSVVSATSHSTNARKDLRGPRGQGLVPAQGQGLGGTGSAEKRRNKGKGVHGVNTMGGMAGMGGVGGSPVSLSPLAVSTVQASLQPLNLMLDGIPVYTSVVGYAALGKVLEKYPTHPLNNNNNNSKEFVGGMHSPLSQGLLPSPGSSEGSGKPLLPHIRASLDTNIYTSPNAKDGPAGLYLSLTTKSLKHGASHPLAGPLMTLPTAVSGQGVMGQKGPGANLTKNKGDIAGVPVTVVIPSVSSKKETNSAISADTSEFHTPALSSRLSVNMDTNDANNSSGSVSNGDLALVLESTLMSGQAIDGSTRGMEEGALSSRDSRRFGSEASRSNLITPHTAPETPFVSVPNAMGLSYSDNHSNKAPTLSVSRERTISMGSESDMSQMDPTQGLDQAEDILNGLDV